MKKIAVNLCSTLLSEAALLTFAGCEEENNVIDGISYNNVGYGISMSCSDPSITVARPLAVYDDLPVAMITFYSCTDLEEIYLPANAATIRSIDNCPSLRVLEINDGLSTIDYLGNVPSLTELTLPASLKRINGLIFGTDFHTIRYEGTVEQMMSMEFSFTAYFGIADEVYVNGTLLTDPVLSSNVSSIPDYAFTGMTQLRSVTIDTSLQNIGDRAFLNCTSLTDIYYKGTMQMWEIIGKGNGWSACDTDSGSWVTLSFTVHCTDGDIEYGPVLPQE